MIRKLGMKYIYAEVRLNPGTYLTALQWLAVIRTSLGVEKYVLITGTFSILVNKTISQNKVLITGVPIYYSKQLINCTLVPEMRAGKFL